MSYPTQMIGLIFIQLTVASLGVNAAEFACKPFGYWDKESAALYGIRAMTENERAADKALRRLRDQKDDEQERRCGLSSLFRFPTLSGDHTKEELKAYEEEIAKTKRCEEKVEGEFKPKREKIYASYDSNSNICRSATLKGRIDAGDGERFAAWLKGNPFVSGLELQSPGGSVSAAMEIGRIIRSRFIKLSSAEHGGESPHAKRYDCRRAESCCASACVLILVAGVSIYPGNIGLHRPTSADFGWQDYSKVRSRLADGMSQIRSYLAEMETSPKLFEKMMAIPSSELLLLGELDARSLMSGVPSKPLQGREIYPPTVHEWALARCRERKVKSFCVSDVITDEFLKRAISSTK